MKTSWTSAVWDFVVRFLRVFMVLALVAVCDSAVEPIAPDKDDCEEVGVLLICGADTTRVDTL
jgi:hypothetical protein